LVKKYHSVKYTCHFSHINIQVLTTYKTYYNKKYPRQVGYIVHTIFSLVP